MAPPVPDFLALNGTPDPRAPTPRDPESQLPLIPHIPGVLKAPADSPSDSGNPGEPGDNPTNAVDFTGASLIPMDNSANAPRPKGFANYAEQDKDALDILTAIDILGKANIQVPLPGDFTPTPNLEMDEDFISLDPKMQRFIRVLEKTGRITRAAEIAGIPRSSANVLRRKNPKFGELVTRALSYRAEMIEDEAIRRAVQGVQEDVYYMGAVCGSKRNYSDALLSKLLEGNMPEKYRQNHKIELDAKLAVATLVLPATTSAEDWAAQNSGTIIEVEPEDEYAT